MPAPRLVGTDAEEGAGLCPQTLITPLPPLWDAQGRRKGLGCFPQQLPVCQERLRAAAAGIAKPSPLPCLRLVFASVTRVQQ